MTVPCFAIMLLEKIYYNQLSRHVTVSMAVQNGETVQFHACENQRIMAHPRRLHQKKRLAGNHFLEQ
jgi:hypothetical protein